MFKFIFYSYGRIIGYVLYFAIAIPSFLWLGLWSILIMIPLAGVLFFYLLWFDVNAVEYVKNYVNYADSIIHGKVRPIKNKDTFMYRTYKKYYNSSDEFTRKRQNYLEGRRLKK